MSHETNDDRPRNERYAIEELGNALSAFGYGISEYKSGNYTNAGVKFAEAVDHLRLAEGEVTSYETVHPHITAAINQMNDAFDELDAPAPELFVAGWKMQLSRELTHEAHRQLVEGE